MNSISASFLANCGGMGGKGEASIMARRVELSSALLPLLLVMRIPVADPSRCRVNTTLTVGMNNVFDRNPPFVAGAFENGYDESTSSIQGRFWYVSVKKRF